MINRCALTASYYHSTKLFIHKSEFVSRVVAIIGGIFGKTLEEMLFIFDMITGGAGGIILLA